MKYSPKIIVMSVNVKVDLGSTKNKINRANANQKPIHTMFRPKNLEIRWIVTFVLVVLAHINPFNMLAKNIIASRRSINEKIMR